MRPKVLVVEDEAAIRELLEMALAGAGFAVESVGDTAAAESRLAAAQVDLVLLDWMLPGVSGIELARRLRRREDPVPVIMLTARSEEGDRLAGFEAGADDYVTKPFSVRELVARCRAVLRRAARPGDEQPLEIAGLRLDPVSHRVSIEGRPLRLRPTEFRLLRWFMTHPERVLSRAQILDGVWGPGAYLEERTVDVHVRRLRRALAPFARDGLVQTVHGCGYRFSARPA